MAVKPPKPKKGPSGDWASTETKDAFAGHGSLVGGRMVAVEKKDIFAGHAGLVSGSWHSTEFKDKFKGTNMTTARISDIAVHNTAPGGTNKIESENPTGPTSEYSTIAEVIAANPEVVAGMTATTRLLTGTMVKVEETVNGVRKIDVDTFLQGVNFDTSTQFVGTDNG